MNISDLHGALFPTKEMYLMCCGRLGKLPLLKGLSRHYRRKAEYENLHLMDGMTFTALGNPRMKPYLGPTDFSVIDYCHRNKSNGIGQFVHFFSDDYGWGKTLWAKPEQVLHSLSKFDGLFAPDYSLYCDYSNPRQFLMFNKSQIYKSRFIGALAQNLGFQVIPTASCGDVDSFEYCYDGLPEYSIIAFCGTGAESHSHRQHLEYALLQLEAQKHPVKIIIYGPEIEVVGLRTPLLFIEDQISKFHRYGKSSAV